MTQMRGRKVGIGLWSVVVSLAYAAWTAALVGLVAYAAYTQSGVLDFRYVGF